MEERLWVMVGLFQPHYVFQFYPQQIIMFVNDMEYIPKMCFTNAFYTTWKVDKSTAKCNN